MSKKAMYILEQTINVFIAIAGIIAAFAIFATIFNSLSAEKNDECQAIYNNIIGFVESMEDNSKRDLLLTLNEGSDCMINYFSRINPESNVDFDGEIDLLATTIQYTSKCDPNKDCICIFKSKGSRKVADKCEHFENLDVLSYNFSGEKRTVDIVNLLGNLKIKHFYFVRPKSYSIEFEKGEVNG